MKIAAEQGAGDLASFFHRIPAGESSASMTEPEFERLYAATAGSIFRYVVATTGRRDVAEDIVQETYCRLLVRKISVTDMDSDHLRRYLFRIATNLLRDRWRSSKDKICSELPELGVTQNLEHAIDMKAMLEHLKPRERELLWLAYMEGMDHNEIAEATGLNRFSVRTLLFRARLKARKFLRPEGESA